MPPPAFPNPETPIFRCETSRENGTARVRALGELDTATVSVLAAQLAELRQAGVRQLVLDLRGLEFMDSTGLRLILDHDAAARQDGFTFSLIRGPHAIQRVFELTGMAVRLPFIEP